MQVCGLEWNRHHKELLSGHGFSTSSHHNQLCLWRYPSMTKVGALDRHTSRVLDLCQVCCKSYTINYDNVFESNFVNIMKQFNLWFGSYFIKLKLNYSYVLQNPDGLTVVSAGADETLRFWNVFGPPVIDNYETDLDNLLSLKVSPLRWWKQDNFLHSSLYSCVNSNGDIDLNTFSNLILESR